MVQHEFKAVPKKLSVVRFPSLPDPMCDIRHNKEIFPAELVDFTHAGKNHWGFYSRD